MERPSTIRKIAVVRANGIGDYLFSQPALAALRQAYPHADIVLLGKAWHAAFLAGRPGPVTRAIAIPPYGGVSAEPGAAEDGPALDRFFQAMQAEQFDLAIQMHGGGRYSNPFTHRLKARYCVGLRTPDALPLDRDIPYIYWQPEIARYLEVVSLVDAKPLSLEPKIALLPNDDREVDNLNLPAGPYVVLHPGASDPRRRWPATNFAAVGKILAERGAHIIVIGAGDELALVHQIVNDVPNAIALGDRLSLGGLAALLARASVVVANDSGPFHLANAVGAQTVGIFWCGNLINGGPMTRKRHRPAISWRLHCPVCSHNTLHSPCEHRASFVADVAVEEVARYALELYDEARSVALDNADPAIALNVG
jgi:ADP-heptose:LPS heptosyltransferase